MDVILVLLQLAATLFELHFFFNHPLFYFFYSTIVGSRGYFTLFQVLCQTLFSVTAFGIDGFLHFIEE